MSESNIQHKSQSYLVGSDGFNDHGERVRVDWDQEKSESAEDNRGDALKRFLCYATEGKFDVERFGRKLATIAFLSGCFPGMKQAEFAEKMEVSPGRISQLLNDLRRIYHR
ncbi:MAG: helix-turn-helix transcriptional regulator [Verrucomicrobiota bacterium]